MHPTHAVTLAVFSLVATLGLSACGGSISSDEQARRAYLGLDKSVEKSLQLGFDGFNAASSANIPPQSTNGDETGTLTISGQVDQVAASMLETEKTMNELQFATGLETVEATPELLRDRAVQVH